jgi:aminoglycoside phosphotransferase (APT) family kinase protein
MSYIEELREVIRKLHGVDSTHIASVPVTETFNSQTVWKGVVEVFDLVGHPNATRLYAWSHQTDYPDRPWRHVTVLHGDAITSPLLAVRAAIIREFKGNAPAEA